MKATFIATVLNEEKTISFLLDSLLTQTELPDEIIITDGGSTDNAIDIIKSYIPKFKKLHINLKLLYRQGNRSVGRNAAIQQARNKIILCSDAGCLLDKHWVKNISAPFKRLNTELVAGYYKGMAKTGFQKCLIPYVLVMEDKVNPDTFLPASRSMAFTKSVWMKAGKFSEKLSHNEDYAFAKRLSKIGIKPVFCKDAITYWIPRNTIKEAYTMFYRFALGDAEAHIFRPKVVLILLRYLIGGLLLLFFLSTKQMFYLILLLILFILYCAWAISKNYRYIQRPEAFYYLPLLQLTSDTAVIFGTLRGIA